jgi:hypothetical protein
MKCNCGNNIPTERYNLGYETCLSCGDKVANQNRRYGYICYGHKTAGAIVVTSKAGYNNYKKVSYRKCKGSNMASASLVGSEF